MSLRFRKPDSYHTSYALSGLASAQHHVVQVIETLDKLRAEWKSTGGKHNHVAQFLAF